MDLRKYRPGLRYRLAAWDPIGLADFGSDEYDFMLEPLLTRLNAGAGRTEIGEFLWSELQGQPGRVLARQEVDSMAGEIVAWWEKPRFRERLLARLGRLAARLVRRIARRHTD